MNIFIYEIYERYYFWYKYIIYTIPYINIHINGIVVIFKIYIYRNFPLLINILIKKKMIIKKKEEYLNN